MYSVLWVGRHLGHLLRHSKADRRQARRQDVEGAVLEMDINMTPLAVLEVVLSLFFISSSSTPSTEQYLPA